jgi:hypothetical protein
MHSTNYTNTFIEVAEDCKAATGTIPPEKTEPTIARMQFELIQTNPYRYTSDDVLFAVYAARNSIAPEELEARRAEFFAKGQACLRASPLAKSYGWGIHHDREGKVALYAQGSEEYDQLRADGSLTQLKAMRSSR